MFLLRSSDSFERSSDYYIGRDDLKLLFGGLTFVFFLNSLVIFFVYTCELANTNFFCSNSQI